MRCLSVPPSIGCQKSEEWRGCRLPYRRPGIWHTLGLPWQARTANGARVSGGLYLATRRFESAVPIVLNTVPSSLADVTIQNLSALLAQFFRSVDIGSPSVLT